MAIDYKNLKKKRKTTKVVEPDSFGKVELCTEVTFVHFCIVFR